MAMQLLPRWLLLLLALLLPSIRSKRVLPSSGYPADLTASLFQDIVEEEFNISHRRLPSAKPPVFSKTSDHKVSSLPGLSPSISLEHFAGHIAVDDARNNFIFYWLFKAATNAAMAPLIIWLNGGPGCSSMDGLFLEMGPLRLEPDKSIKINPFSWHNAGNLLFIDQPVGTGFSYTTNNQYANNDNAISSNFYSFLINFLKVYSEFSIDSNGKRSTVPVYITGESHAGHYIPCISKYILDKNKEVAADESGGGFIINLKGVALGNPWLDPSSQYDVSEFAHGQGLITRGQEARLKELEKDCKRLLLTGKYNHKVCFALMDNVIDSSTTGGAKRVIIYDSRKYSHHAGYFPPGHEAVETFLNRNEVKAAIHSSATPQKFQECTDPPYNALSYQDGKPATAELAAVLAADIKVLIFVGQFDIVCNHIGVERAIAGLNWPGSSGYLEAQRGIFVVDKQPAGYVKQFLGLQYLLVLDSGHMVPMDQPRVALEMISLFINDKSLSGGSTKIAESRVGPVECATAKVYSTGNPKPGVSRTLPTQQVWSFLYRVMIAYASMDHTYSLNKVLLALAALLVIVVVYTKGGDFRKKW